uniref:Uncharacterized protein n=1 Tax=Arundo donax TaxID=35708 RepID=A0A0A9FJ79_ARUDO
MRCVVFYFSLVFFSVPPRREISDDFDGKYQDGCYKLVY